MTLGPQQKKASALRKARIEVATLALDAALDDLQQAALVRGAELSQSVYNAGNALRLDVACRALNEAHLELAKARR